MSVSQNEIINPLSITPLSDADISKREIKYIILCFVTLFGIPILLGCLALTNFKYGQDSEYFGAHLLGFIVLFFAGMTSFKYFMMFAQALRSLGELSTEGYEAVNKIKDNADVRQYLEKIKQAGRTKLIVIDANAINAYMGDYLPFLNAKNCIFSEATPDRG